MQSPGARRGRPEPVATPSDDGLDSPRVGLGAWLRAERLGRGFTYADVERDTHINRIYLEAIEEEHYDVLPAPVYTRGFVRSYARWLGIDAGRALSMLPERLPTPPGLEPSAALRRPGRDAPAIALPRVPSMRVPSLRIPALQTPRGGFRFPSPSRLGAAMPRVRLGAEARRWMLAAAGVLTLILAAVFLPRLFADSTPADGGQAPVMTAVATARATVATTPSSGAPAATVPAQATAVATAQATAAAAPSGASGGGAKLSNLVGRKLVDVQQELQTAGLTWVVVEISSPSAAAGQVVGQQPVAGTSMTRGDNVTLIVSRGAPKN
jgi:cytoskeletal protein RodZ